MASQPEVTRWTPWPGPSAKPEQVPESGRPVLVKLRSGAIVGPHPPATFAWGDPIGSSADIVGYAYPESGGRTW